MTALDKYQRIEALGLWRNDHDSQRKDVLISIGQTTLLISDMQERPLAHWSLAAIERSNPGNYPAIYHPDGDHEESLELNFSEKEMIDAIEKLRTLSLLADVHILAGYALEYFWEFFQLSF